MAIKVRFPVFVFTKQGYKTCLGVRDLCIRSKKEIDEGYYQNLEFIDSDGVLRRINKVQINDSIKISFLMHLVHFKKMRAVEIIEAEEFRDLPAQQLKDLMINAARDVPRDIDPQADREELQHIVTRKKNIKEAIEYFSGPLPDFLNEYAQV